MRLTLGMTGMDSATGAAFKAAVEEANARLGQEWQLLPESEASHVVVDMDSMYGPMSWLRMHAAGKRVIGLSAAPRTQTDFHLARPFDTENVVVLLELVAATDGTAEATDAEPSALSGHSDPTPEQVPVEPSTDDLPESFNDEPPEADASTETIPAGDGPADGAAAEATAVDAEPAGVAETSDAGLPIAATGMYPDDTEDNAGAGIQEQPPAKPRARRLLDWLEPGALTGRVRCLPGAGLEPLLIDPGKRQYHGPTLLKPLAGYFVDILDADAFESLDDAAWDTARAELGPAQPLVRLQWYGGLLAGDGKLLPGHDPDGRYKLGKWPQTEREFPKNFRLAATMMKGPATLDEIASASGVELAEVVNFVNANLASGYAEHVPEEPEEPPPAPKPTGLFGRLRGR